MTKHWYIVHAYSNFERKVAAAIKERAQAQGLEDEFDDVLAEHGPDTEILLEDVRQCRKRRVMLTTIVATVLGTVLAIGMDRFPWPKKINTSLDLVLHLPVVIPDIILAAALVVAFGLLRAVSHIFEPGLLNMIIGHITFQVAFVALVVRSRLS